MRLFDMIRLGKPAAEQYAEHATPCTEDASCEEGDHRYTWPCDYAPGTGRFAALDTQASHYAADDDRAR